MKPAFVTTLAMLLYFGVGVIAPNPFAVDGLFEQIADKVHAAYPGQNIKFELIDPTNYEHYTITEPWFEFRDQTTAARFLAFEINGVWYAIDRINEEKFKTFLKVAESRGRGETRLTWHTGEASSSRNRRAEAYLYRIFGLLPHPSPGSLDKKIFLGLARLDNLIIDSWSMPVKGEGYKIRTHKYLGNLFSADQRTKLIDWPESRTVSQYLLRSGQIGREPESVPESREVDTTLRLGLH